MLRESSIDIFHQRQTLLIYYKILFIFILKMTLGPKVLAIFIATICEFKSSAFFKPTDF